MPDRLWTIVDVVKYTGIPLSSLYKMTAPNSGCPCPIPHLKIGGRLRFKKAEIDEWLGVQSFSPVDALRRAKAIAQRLAH